MVHDGGGSYGGVFGGGMEGMVPDERLKNHSPLSYYYYCRGEMTTIVRSAFLRQLNSYSWARACIRGISNRRVLSKTFGVLHVPES